MIRSRSILLASLLCLAWAPGLSAQTEYPGHASAFARRAVLAAGGSAAGFIALGYTTFAVKGGPEGCDLCWEVTVAGFAGSIIGAAAATTLADGDWGGGLKGAALGTAAGLAAVAILDQFADPGDTAIPIAFMVPQSVITAYFSGR